jgi:hypothetical protein
MSEDVEIILREIEDSFARLRAAMVRQPAAPTARSAEPDRRLLKLISVGEAAGLSCLSKSRVRDLCSEHIYGASLGGFGYKSGGRWLVATELFLEYLRSTRVSRV